MPCEDCHVQFTVFRRKRSCTECKRFYCNNCLTDSKRQQRLCLCARCAVFAKRPLLRSDLLQLKPKDLIFYLQSKHISTAGCVEKDELIGLILNHVQQQPQQHSERSSGNGSAGSSPNHSSQKDAAHAFDSLKQSCQNFFSNISDNISDSLAAFDAKTGTSNYNNTPNKSRARTRNARAAENITTQQPRMAHRREMRAYSACQQTTAAATAGTATTTTSTARTVNASSSSSSAKSSSAVSPTHNEALAQVTIEDCECSENDDDDELDIIATYNEHLKAKSGSASQEFSTHIELLTNGISSSSPSSSNNSAEQQQIPQTAVTKHEEISQSSSFEELGAIGGSSSTATAAGGISDDSKVTTDTNSSNIEHWQLLDVPIEAEQANEAAETAEATVATSMTNDTAAAVSSISSAAAQERHKKVTRRRSDSYLKQRQLLSDDDDDDEDAQASGIAAATSLATATTPAAAAAATTNSSSCQRCGKNKTNIRRHVERMRQHLESAQMSEEDIKRELSDFLNYLEKRTKSIDCSDTETAASSLNATPCVPRLPEEAQLDEHRHHSHHHQQQTQTQTHLPSELDFAAVAAALLRDIEFGTTASLPRFDGLSDDEGINVYASALDDTQARPSRFISLHSISSLEELENLSVKQLKEVLTLNRVDYKGCCEKQELLDRVIRLWRTLKEAPEIEKLPTDELCKICMDAPIECVILECGHMATCTSCGKVLSECPICRQYIVRVVRFFKA